MDEQTIERLSSYIETMQDTLQAAKRELGRDNGPECQQKLLHLAAQCEFVNREIAYASVV